MEKPEEKVDGYRFLPPGLAAWIRTMILREDFKGDIPWTPLKKPLSQTSFALVTSAGMSVKSDLPFDMERESPLALVFTIVEVFGGAGTPIVRTYRRRGAGFGAVSAYHPIHFLGHFNFLLLQIKYIFLDPLLKRFAGYLGDIVNYDVLVVLFNRVLKIPLAPGTGRHQRRGACGFSFLQPFAGRPQG